MEKEQQSFADKGSVPVRLCESSSIIKKYARYKHGYFKRSFLSRAFFCKNADECRKSCWQIHKIL